MMFFRLSRRAKVNRILFVSLSNIGDVVLTLPAFDVLREMFPSAQIAVVVGPKGRAFFASNPNAAAVFVLDKKVSFPEKWAWLMELRRREFDLVVDLRNSMLPFLLRVKAGTPPVMAEPRLHMRDKHLARVNSVLGEINPAHHRYGISVSRQEIKHVDMLLMGLRDYVLVAPGAADDKKRWPEESFAAVITHLMKKRGQRVVVVGDKKDIPVVSRVLKSVPGGVCNLCGMTSLTELSIVADRAKAALVNDSGVMHVCSYMDIPTVALFGPTDPFFYGPWSSVKRVIRGQESMGSILNEDVMSALDEVIKR